jgi:hypothetical protein
MKISVQNFGIISDASIEINGISLIVDLMTLERVLLVRFSIL